MSYSFSVKAVNKEHAKIAVETEFSKVVVGQPIHARDRAAALAAAGAMIDLLVDDPTLVISVSVNGYVSWRANADKVDYGKDSDLQGASVSVTAALVKE